MKGWKNTFWLRNARSLFTQRTICIRFFSPPPSFFPPIFHLVYPFMICFNLFTFNFSFLLKFRRRRLASQFISCHYKLLWFDVVQICLRSRILPSSVWRRLGNRRTRNKQKKPFQCFWKTQKNCKQKTVKQKHKINFFLSSNLLIF